MLSYDAKGELRFFVNMYGTSSNGRYADPRALLRLSDGRIALAAYTQHGIYIKDATLTERTVQGSSQMMLLMFSPAGQFLSSRALGMKNILKMEEGPWGKLYLLGRKKGYSADKDAIFYLEAGEEELKEMELPDEAVLDMEVFRDRVWFLTSVEEKNGYWILNQTISLYQKVEDDPEQPFFQHFSKTFKGHQKAKASLIHLPFPGKMEVVLLVSKPEAADFTLGEFTADYFSENGVFIFHDDGQIKTRMDLGTLQAGLIRIQPGEKHRYIATVYARENVTIRGIQDSIQVQQQPDYVYERILLGFNQSLQLEWYSSMGSSLVNYAASLPVESGGHLYFSGVLIHHHRFAGEYKERNWRTGFYILRMKDLPWR